MFGDDVRRLRSECRLQGAEERTLAIVRDLDMLAKLPLRDEIVTMLKN